MTVPATGTENEFEVVRSEGMVIEEGDLLDAANLNDLETRIEKIIFDLHSLFYANKEAVYFCGEAYAGSQIGVI